jgi:ERCC4-type nuclease
MIYVDDREPPNVQEMALKYFPECKITRLEVGDIVCTDNSVCIERKSVEDLAGSLMDGRLMRQIGNMKNNFDNNWVIIVGDERKLYTHRYITFYKEQFIGIVGSLFASYGIHTWQVRDMKDYFLYSKDFINKSNGEEKDLSKVYRKVPKCKDAYVGMLRQIPFVGDKQAEAILDQYTIRQLHDVSEGDLCRIRGVGKKTAKKVKELFY